MTRAARMIVVLAAAMAGLAISAAEDGFVSQQVLAPASSSEGNIVDLSDLPEAPRFSSALADAQVYEQQSLSALLAVICQSEVTGFFSKILLQTAFPSEIYLPFGVTSDAVADSLINVLRYGHCGRKSVDPKTATLTASAPALSFFIHRLMAESLMTDSSEDAADPSDHVESRLRTELVGSLIQEEILFARGPSDFKELEKQQQKSVDDAGFLTRQINKAKDNSPGSLNALFAEYRERWLATRRAIGSDIGQIDARLTAFEKLMETYAQIVAHQDLRTVQAAFGHVNGEFCFAPKDHPENERVVCSEEMAESQIKIYSNLLFRQVHAIAVPPTLIDLTDKNEPAQVVQQRKELDLHLFFGIQAVVNLLEDPCSIADASVAKEAAALQDRLMITGAASSSSPGNKLKKENTLFAVFKKLGWASETMSPQGGQIPLGGKDATSSATLSLRYIAAVQKLRAAIRAKLFTPEGTPVAFTGHRVSLLEKVDSFSITPIATGYFSYEVFMVHEPAPPSYFLPNVMKLTKAILMLDAANKAGVKAGDDIVNVPFVVLGAAQVSYGRGRHDKVFKHTSLGVAKYSEDKFVLRAASKWQQRDLFVTPELVGYKESGRAETDAKKNLYFTEMEAIMLPSPTTEQARRDKALAAAAEKQAAGHICGSILYTSAKDLRKKRRRRRRLQSADAFNFVGQALGDKLRADTKRGDVKHDSAYVNMALGLGVNGRGGGGFGRGDGAQLAQDNPFWLSWNEETQQMSYHAAPYRATYFNRHSAALYLPDPTSPTSRFFTFCSKDPMPQGELKSGPVTKWVLLQAKPFLQTFCAAAHNYGLTHRFRLEERFSFETWALTVPPLPQGHGGDDSGFGGAGGNLFGGRSGKGATGPGGLPVADMKSIRHLASSNLKKEVIDALIQHEVLQRPAPLPANAPEHDKFAQQYAYALDCGVLFDDAFVNQPKDSGNAVLRGGQPAERDKFNAQVPVKLEGRAPLDLFPVRTATANNMDSSFVPIVVNDKVKALSSNLGKNAPTKHHRVFDQIESIAPTIFKETFEDHAEWIVARRAAMEKLPKDAVKSVAAKLTLLNPGSLTNEQMKAMSHYPATDMAMQVSDEAASYCQFAAAEKATMEARKKKGEKWGLYTAQEPKLKDRQFFSVHAAMTAGERPVLLSMTPGAKLMAWFAEAGLGDMPYYESLFKKAGSGRENFVKRFAPAYTADMDRTDTSVWVSETDKLVIISFNCLQKSDGLLKVQWKLTGDRLEKSSRYEGSNEIVTRAIAEHPGKQVVLTGFCLGGALALHFSRQYGLPAYAFNPAPLVDVYWRVALGSVLAGIAGVVNYASLTTVGRGFNILTSPLGGQSGAYWRLVVPRTHFPVSKGVKRLPEEWRRSRMDEYELYLATHQAVPGVAGLNQIHAVAGDRKPASYFLLDKDGNDPSGYRLHLYPSICSRSQTATHLFRYLAGMLPSSTHPAFRDTNRPRFVTFPSVKPYSVEYKSDSEHLPYALAYDILDKYQEIQTNLPPVQYWNFPATEKELLSGKPDPTRGDPRILTFTGLLEAGEAYADLMMLAIEAAGGGDNLWAPKPVAQVVAPQQNQQQQNQQQNRPLPLQSQGSSEVGGRGGSGGGTGYDLLQNPEFQPSSQGSHHQGNGGNGFQRRLSFGGAPTHIAGLEVLISEEDEDVKEILEGHHHNNGQRGSNNLRRASLVMESKIEEEEEDV